MNGLVLHDANPEAFRKHLREALNRITNLPQENRIVFAKAWNEWAEGNHLEPDMRYGHGFLQVVKDEIYG